MTDESLFLQAVAIPDPAERAAFLDRECVGDPDLRREVEELLAAHAAGGPLDAPPAADAPTADLPADPPTATSGNPAGATDDTPRPDAGTVLGGRYKLVEPIGEGGMGAVWLARQTEPVKRLVAVKLIKAGMDSKAVLARFEAERQALALMDHPNIAKVLDAGATPDGRPFFVMELVRGVPITKFCDGRKLTPKERLELFVPVCNAIQHAHQKGVIHRDIKPSNVLVALYDDRPVPKVIDFGVAKAAGQPLTEHTLATGFGAVVGTPEYMSPEQASLNNPDVDTRSDVYSLGVLLYELLAGSPPFSRNELERVGLLEVFRAIREQEPPRPSARLSTADALPTLSANRGTEPRRLTALLRGELDWIVMKALEKDRARRYPTANGFAADVQSHLAGEPVQAVPPSPGYRFKKFLRRNKGPLAAAAAVVLVLLAGVATTAWQAAERRRDRDVIAARTRQSVESALGQAEAALRADRLAEVDAALAVADQGLTQLDAPDLTDRVDAVKKDRAMVARLNDISEQVWVVSLGTSFAPSSRHKIRSARAYKDASADYGLAIGDEPPIQTRDKLHRSLIPVALLTALGEWYFLDPAQPGLRAVLDAADPDPFRSAVRTAVADKDQGSIDRLAGSVDGATLPPWFAVSLGMRADAATGLRLMRTAWLAHPNYYPLAHRIGILLYWGEKEVESVHWFRLGVGLRPDSAVAHFDLYHSLWWNQQESWHRDEGETAVRRAIRLGPGRAEYFTSLGLVLMYRKDVAGAEAAYRQAAALDPSSFLARVGLCHVAWVRKDWDRLIDALEQAHRTPDYGREHEPLEELGHSMAVLGFVQGDLLSALRDANRTGLAVRYYVRNHPDKTDLKGRDNPRETPAPIRYGVSRAAVLAASGQIADAPPASEWPAIRSRAREWLSADLAHWKGCVLLDPTANRTAAHKAMGHWLADPDLKTVRDEAELAKLPADEQAEWRKLWAEVRSLRDRTTPPEPAPPPREVKR